jgi:GT2 family glycosyltransferase
MLVQALQGQQLPTDWSMEIIVVDDGSGAPHSELVARLADSSTTIICLPENTGRSTAVASGIDRANGDLLMVIDSDCLPANASLLAAHIAAMSDRPNVASNGPVCGYDDRFWSRYQNNVARSRAARRSAMPGTVGSTANCCLRRRAYLAVGGLDRNYKGYGFEDRDLLLRLATLGSITWTPDAVVKHMDALSLSNVCNKIRESGSGNSALFAARHPAAYRELGYARFDARGRPWLARLGRAIDPFVQRLAAVVEPCLDRLPFFVARFLVKVLSALAFLAGTSRAAAAPR